MPFKSKKQEAFLKINEPKVYKKWREDYKNGGVNIGIPGKAINVPIPELGASLNVADDEVTATVEDGPTWAQINKPWNKNKDATALLEQELYVDEHKTVHLNARFREGSGGDSVGITAVGEDWDFNANTDGDNVNISGNIVKKFNKGGMAGCPMDGAVIKGGTKIKPERYTHGKRKV
jgi:ssDNA-binding replication factor A large subunit